MLSALVHRYERWRADRDPARVAHPFEWGLGHVGLETGAGDPASALAGLAREVLDDPSIFFPEPGPPGGEVRPGPPERDGGRRTRFESAVALPEAETNRASVRLWEPARRGDRAMVVLPQWNAEPDSHVALCRWLARRGIAAARLTLPYHDDRRPGGEPRGDLAVSANLGRTLGAVRQAVADVRRTRAWLETRGHRRIGILGTSLGSCIAFLALATGGGFRAVVLHHVSSDFGEAVWRGISTRHVRERLERTVDLETLRRIWAPISPVHFVDRVPDDSHSLLLIGKYDLTFPYDLSIRFEEAYRRWARPHRAVHLPWGHYTSGVFPFSVVLTGRVLRYLDRRL